MSQPVFIVICAIEYSGALIEAVYFDRERAIAMCDVKSANNRTRSVSYHVEIWRDGDLRGEEIFDGM